ncbi:MAG: threonine synthase [Verrucomicrobia bacterium]|nr:MAG: threonine synthase [Verrucomicrobiota bacterium]
MALLRFHSTNGEAPPADLREALLRGQAPDRGLYLPERFPRIDPAELAEFGRLSYAEIAFRVLGRYTEGLIEPERLRVLCEEAYDYEVPLERVTGRVHVLRLDRGPTASFKDFAARMMARWMGHFLAQEGRRLTILTATSGDTGSAVAAAFHRVPGIRVFVLFPRGEVSDRQRKQMTTLGDNIRTIALEGKFDDCQALVKRAFADPELAPLNLSSANSINVGRLLPQSVYYFHAAARIAAPGEPVIFSVPSGNFGNMMGAVIAGRMGLPLRRLLVPVNANDEFPRFLATGVYRKVEPSRACLSNAMNVGHPSNLARLVAVYGGRMDEQGRLHRAPDLEAMRRDLFSVSVSDEETCATIRQAWDEHRLLLEPHGAVGWRGWLAFQAAEGAGEDLPVAVLETAHPAKFPEAIERTLGFAPEAPPSLARLDDLPERYDTLPADYARFRDYLREQHDSNSSN